LLTVNLAAATPKPKPEKTMSRRSTVKLSFSSPWHPIEFVASVESDRPPTRTVTIVSSAARTSASGNQLLHVAVACCSARRPSTSGHKRPCQLMPKPGSCLCPRHSKQLLHVNFFAAREEIKATTPVQRAWIL